MPRVSRAYPNPFVRRQKKIGEQQRFGPWPRVQGVGPVINDFTRSLGIEGDGRSLPNVVGIVNVNFGLSDPTAWDAQAFQTNTNLVTSSINLFLTRNGNPTDNLVVDIYTDASGSPGTSIGSSSIVASTIATSTAWVNVPISVSLTGNTRYWIVARRNGSLDNSNFISWATISSASSSYPFKFTTDSGTSWTSASFTHLFQLNSPTIDSSYGLWRASTNLVANGGFETDTTGWALSSGTGAIARDTTQSKFGGASLKVTVGIIGDGCIYNPSVKPSLSASTSYTLSVWMNVPSGMSLDVQANDNNGSAWLNSTVSGGGGIIGTGTLNRYTFTASTFASTTSLENIIFRVPSASSVISGDFYVDGVQLEQQPYATPYIETNGASASRAAGYVKLPTSFLNTTQGWIAQRLRLGSIDPIRANVFLHIFQDGSNFNQLALTTNTIEWSAPSLAGILTRTQVVGETLTLIAAWISGHVYISVNGSAFTDVGAVLQNMTPTDIYLGMNASQSSFIDGEFLWAAGGTGTLSDANAATIDGFGNAGSAVNYPALSAPTFYWPADTDLYYIPTVASGSLVTATLAASIVSGSVVSYSPTKRLAPIVVGSPSIIRSPTKNVVPTATVSSSKVVKQPSRTFASTTVTTPAINKTPQKVLSGTATSSATVIRSPGKVLQGLGTTVATLTRSGMKVLSAITVATPTVIKQPIRTLSASVTTIASITARLITTRVLSATAGTTATVSRSVLKVLTATVVSTASSIRNPLKTLATSVVIVASRTIAGSHVLSATVTTVSTVTRLTSRTIVAVGSSAATVVRASSRFLTNSIGTGAGITRFPSTTIRGAVTTLASRTTADSRTLSAVVTVIGTITRVPSRTLAAATTGTAIVTRIALKVLAASTTAVASRIVDLSHVLIAPVTTTAKTVRDVSHTVVGTVASVGDISRGGITLSAVVTAVATTTRTVTRSFTTTVATAPAIVRRISRTISGSAATTATVQRAQNIVVRTLTAIVSTSARIAPLPGKALTVTTVAVASVARSTTRTITAASVAVPRVIRNIARTLDIATTNVTASVAPSITRLLSTTSVVVATVASSISNTILTTVVANPTVERVLAISRTAVATSVAVVEKSPVVSLLTTATTSASLVARQLTRLFVDLIARMQGRAYSAVVYRRYISASFKEWNVTTVFRSWIAKIPFRRYSERFWK